MNKGADMDNMGEIYKEHVHELYSYARHLGFNKEIAMDAIHDVFYNILANENHLPDILHIRIYLFCALKNRLLNILKQESKTIELPDGRDDINELPFTIDVTIEEEIIQREEDEKIRRRVEKLIESLTDRQREIIYLRYMQNLDYEEIAQVMNITASVCRKHVSKAIARMRKTGDLVILLYLMGKEIIMM